MDARDVTRREFVRDTALAAGALATGAAASRTAAADAGKMLNCNPKMAYRRCGRTGLMASAVALGGHYKHIAKALPEGINPKGIWGVQHDDPALLKNRQEVISHKIEAGINWIDACKVEEVKVHSRALQGRRDRMYLACSWCQREMRSMKDPSAKKLLEVLDWGLKDAGLDYADLWRSTVQQADNVARAVSEFKESEGLSRAEQVELDAAMQVAWANLPPGYERLAQWRCV